MLPGFPKPIRYTIFWAIKKWLLQQCKDKKSFNPNSRSLPLEHLTSQWKCICVPGEFLRKERLRKHAIRMSLKDDTLLKLWSNHLLSCTYSTSEVSTTEYLLPMTVLFRIRIITNIRNIFLHAFLDQTLYNNMYNIQDGSWNSHSHTGQLKECYQ